MLLNIAIAGILMLVTTVIHAGGMMMALHSIQSEGGRLKQLLRRRSMFRIAGIVLLMFLASLMEVFVWAASYLVLNAIEGFEKAVYFSMVTYTTLGYGDIVLHERWRVLASFEAANGIIMFGWTTAIVMAVIRQVYFSEKQ